MHIAKGYRDRGAAAVYLRCYPYDSQQMATHLSALEAHADRLAILAPAVFLDNGVSSRTVRPQLRKLLARVAEGVIGTVLVPGPWVFSLDDRTADSVVSFLQGAGAQVVELPSRWDIPRPQRRVMAGTTGRYPATAHTSLSAGWARSTGTVPASEAPSNPTPK